MEFWGKVIEILDVSMETPKSYGWFHLMFFALSILFGAFLCWKFKNPSEKTVKNILLAITLVVVVLEIYKQINYTFSYSNGVIETDYQWYAFPFQFCSMPMYVGILAVIAKGVVHKAACAFLATYSLFAGLCVMFYPADVFISTIGINIQTMICHGSMISIAIFLIGRRYVKAEHKTMLYSMPVFAAAMAVAMILNEVAVRVGFIGDETFNMFFISPHFEPSLPVYSIVQGILPFPWCTLVYFIGFSLASYILLLISMGIMKICDEVNRKKAIAAN